MASVRTPQEAILFAKEIVSHGDITNTNLQARIVNNAADRMWMFAPWSWTIGQTDQSTLVEDQEDYTITDPTDVLHLVRAEIFKASQNNQGASLDIVHSLASQTATKGQPRSIALQNATTLRLWPMPSGIATADPGKLLVWYKKARPEIVISGASGTQFDYDDPDSLVFPDEWFWVYQEIVTYYAMKFTADARAGGATIASAGEGLQIRYSGQLAEMMDALNQMSVKEKVFLDSDGQGVNG